ncbi:MAG: hypothetical protein ACR2OO_09335 [Thermomicrobiales bacterium]
MPGWLVAVLVSFFLLCVGGGSLGHFVVLPKIRTTLAEQQAVVSDQLAESVKGSISDALDRSANARPDGIVGLEADDLDANNAVDAGRSGITTGTGGASIFGSLTEIDARGITLSFGDAAGYSAVPAVVGGRIDFTQATMSGKVLGVLLTKDGFERGMENGINGALDLHRLTPVSITLHAGRLTIVTKPLNSSTN